MDKVSKIILQDGEYFKPVIGYEGKYEISNKGRIYSLLSGRFMKFGVHEQGYLRIDLHSGSRNTRKKFFLHRLIALNFIPNPRNVETVNHINGNKQDNRIENLEWMTNMENVQHGIDNGLIGKCGESAANSILTNQKVKWIREKVEEGVLTRAEISKSLNVEYGVVHAVLTGKTWSNVYGDVIPFKVKSYPHNLIGQQLGYLTVISRYKGSMKYVCQCVCGKTVIRRHRALSSDYTRSCGCVRKRIETVKPKLPYVPKYADLIGQKIGNITVLKRIPQPIDKKKKGIYFLCKDNLGNEVVKRSDKLKKNISPQNNTLSLF